MTKYYFLATSLPPLQLTVPPDISFEEFIHLAKINMFTDDYAKIRTIRRFYDIQNIKAFWKNEELDPRGNLNEVDLEESLLARGGLPAYVYDFMDHFESREQRLQNFSALIASYYKNEIQKSTEFLHDYLVFERDWRLVFTAFRAKKLKRNLEKELQFEDPNDDLVAQILAQKDSPTFIPPNGYQDLLPLFEEHADSPLELHKALCEYRFDKIASLVGVDVFSINYILSYMTLLILVEKWHELDKMKGMEVISKVVNHPR